MYEYTRSTSEILGLWVTSHTLCNSIVDTSWGAATHEVSGGFLVRGGVVTDRTDPARAVRGGLEYSDLGPLTSVDEHPVRGELRGLCGVGRSLRLEVVVHAGHTERSEPTP
ncbi:hypothetical protein GSI_02237 [Ganoderma sinense ZZ0214-1]|uniref:Uncharacterized protein n=1 Tax=Ganoderma sinense ZZ0214-1 TaxID=1077348 RepID=A0A2G8SP25_9APHY|nr:hypothetical protein GSI_02237 [Ganoderma sinense ZZ0214-1]